MKWGIEKSNKKWLKKLARSKRSNYKREVNYIISEIKDSIKQDVNIVCFNSCTFKYFDEDNTYVLEGILAGKFDGLNFKVDFKKDEKLIIWEPDNEFCIGVNDNYVFNDVIRKLEKYLIENNSDDMIYLDQAKSMIEKFKTLKSVKALWQELNFNPYTLIKSLETEILVYSLAIRRKWYLVKSTNPHDDEYYWTAVGVKDDEQVYIKLSDYKKSWIIHAM